MAANQTKVSKKIDKVLRKLDTLGDDDKALAKQTSYLGQLVALVRQDSELERRESKKTRRVHLTDSKGDGKKARKRKG